MDPWTEERLLQHLRRGPPPASLPCRLGAAARGRGGNLALLRGSSKARSRTDTHHTHTPTPTHTHTHTHAHTHTHTHTHEHTHTRTHTLKCTRTLSLSHTHPRAHAALEVEDDPYAPHTSNKNWADEGSETRFETERDIMELCDLAETL